MIGDFQSSKLKLLIGKKREALLKPSIKQEERYLTKNLLNAGIKV